jgi:hypothetical protein
MDWFVRLFGRRPKGAATPRRPIVHPCLETLEDRLVPTVTYGGGPLLTHVEAQALYLGSGWTGSNTPATLEQYLPYLTGGPYLAALTSAGYGVGTGTATPGQKDPTALPSTITDAVIQNRLAADINGGLLAAPDANRLYVVYVQPNVAVSLGGGQTTQHGILGYHSTFSLAGTPIYYAVVAYPGGAVHNSSLGTSAIDQLTAITSHEVAESVTDPNVSSGWYDLDLNGEIADLTENNPAAYVRLGGYLVQEVADQNDQLLAIPLTAPTFSVSGSVLTVTGTGSGDSFVFKAGSTQDTIVADGITRVVNHSSITKVIFIGGGGNNSLNVVAPAGSSNVSLDFTQLVMTGPGATSLTAAGFNSIIVNGTGGNDTASMGDTPGNDQVALSYAQATLQGSGGQSWQLNGFTKVVALSTHGGGDAVYFYGSPGNDTFTARPGSASLTGAGYQVSALGFTTTQARGGAGGSDVANLYDSPGNDVFSSSNGLAWLQTSDGYNLQTYFFGPTFAYASSGFDTAYLYGTAAADSFVATPFIASMSTPGSLTYAVGFNFVAGFGNGGSDVTALYGSSGNDNFYDSNGFTSVQALGVTFQAYGFTGVTLVGNGGSDTASVFGSGGPDLFVQSGPSATLNRATGPVTNLSGIARTTVTEAPGSGSVAYLYGSSGNDTFTAAGTGGTLANSNAVWSLIGFDAVSLQNATGSDVVSVLSALSFSLNWSSNWVG